MPRSRTGSGDRVHRSQQTAYSRGVDDSGWPGLTDEPDRPRVRVSVTAGVGALVSLVGLCAVLTGLLAAEGLVIAVAGSVLSFAGLVTSNRPARVGAGLAGFGILCSLAAIILAAAALSGAFEWPNADTDEIGRAHAWLSTHWTWMHHRS
jgi:hypothetical protein